MRLILTTTLASVIASASAFNASSACSDECSARFPEVTATATVYTTTTLTAKFNSTTTSYLTSTVNTTNSFTVSTTVSTSTTSTLTSTFSTTTTSTVGFVPLNKRDEYLPSNPTHAALPKDDYASALTSNGRVCRKKAKSAGYAESSQTLPFHDGQYQTSSYEVPSTSAHIRASSYEHVTASSYEHVASSIYKHVTSSSVASSSTPCSCPGFPKTANVTETSIISVVANTTLIQTANPTTTVTATFNSTSTSTITQTSTNIVSTTTSTTLTATATCPASAPTVCSSTNCVNLQNDKRNCGRCGNSCPTGYGCFSGVCGIPNMCNFSGQIYYCYGGTQCVCYQTTEGRGVCANPSGSCGGACTTSNDCPGNNVCATTASIGCGGSGVGSCTTNNDLGTCPNPANGFRRFAREASQRNRPAEAESEETSIVKRSGRNWPPSA